MIRAISKPVFVAMAASGLFVSQAQAQEGLEASHAEPATMIEEVRVTARRREESLQDVPVSVTPVAVPELRARGGRGMEDIAQQTPNFSFEGFSTSGTNSNAVIRGMSNTFTQSRVQNVSFFLDGVYLQRQSMLNFGLLDIERIEIVRGPQGALYGRNAFAGAVNYVSVRPTDEFLGDVEVTFGDNDRQDVVFSLAGALTDNLRGRLSYGRTEYDGHTRNDHPMSHVNTPGPSTHDRLGGWEDQTFSLALDWDITEKVSLGASYYRTDLERELQPYYVLGGVNSQANGFITAENNDMNCNLATTVMVGVPLPVTGNSVWCGELPLQPDPAKRTAAGINVDPRGAGAVAETDLFTLNLDWQINDSVSMTYLFGYTDHTSQTNGGTGEEDTLAGVPQLWQFVPPNSPPNFFPFPILTFAHANNSSARPVSELESDSHDLRFNFEGGDNWTAMAGLYYSKVEDAQTDFLWPIGVCSNVDTQGAHSDGSNENEMANCNVPINGDAWSPWADAPFVTTNDFGTRQHGAPLNHTEFKDDILAIYGSFTWDINEKWTLTAEARYEEEDKHIRRLTDHFALAYGESAPIFPGGPPDFVTYVESAIVVPEDKETQTFFTPRVILQYHVNDERMWWLSAAKGVKTGGFNNTLSEEQLIYDEEQNWTYEFGAKTMHADGRLRMNFAAYYIDWKDIQGTAPPDEFAGLNANDVVDNIGDATGYGLELEILWLMSDHWSIDAGYSYADTSFNDDVLYLAADKFWHCDDIVCPSDGDVGGNQLPRTSEHQFNAGLNFYTSVFDNWELNFRLDGSYQSKQYTDQLNVAWVPSRHLMNTSLGLSRDDGRWAFTLWGRNITDEKYAANAFVQAQFNRLLVGLGQGQSWGVTGKFAF